MTNTTSVSVRFTSSDGSAMTAVLDDDGIARPAIRCYRVLRDRANREHTRHTPCRVDDDALATLLTSRLAVLAAHLVDAMGARPSRHEVLPSSELVAIEGGRR